MKNMGDSNSTPSLFIKKNGHLLALGLIAVLSFWLNFYAISKIGFGNAYYAAAIKSMTQSFHNFFYVAFDPAGMVTVDKPPLGLWVQAIFVLIFGYHGWAMLLPQALAGTASCVMMYILTAKYFGRPAGLISSLVFAVTPAVVVASRNNTMDMQLIFVLLVATWFLFKSIEKGKWRYLFLAAFFVGVGFNVKMLQAYMILPAAAIVYLVFAKEKLIKRIAAGLISVVIVAVVSFAWVAAVDLTPASSRPYVGSSTNNTVWELIIGHNGMERLGGQGGGMGGQRGRNGQSGGWNGNFNGLQGGQNGNANGTPGGDDNDLNGTGDDNRNSNQNGFQSGTRNENNQGSVRSSSRNGSTRNGMQGMQNGGQGRDQGGAAGNDIGTAGVLRLWESGLYGQISWLILLVFFCIVVKIGKINLKQLTLKQGVFFYWILWLITMYVFFSFAGFWHRYYLCMFGPCISALTGIGLVGMVRAFYERKGWKQFLLPAALLAVFAVEILYVWSYTALRAWLVPLMIVPAVLSLILMLIHFYKPKKLLALGAAVCMMLSLLAAPFYWSMTVMLYPAQNVTMPYAGPELASGESTPGMTPNQEALTTGDSTITTLEQYLVAHYKQGSYLVVSQRANDVAQFIVDTGLPAVAYGGFLGSDKAITLNQLKQLVKEGKVTYFLVTGSGGMGGMSGSELVSYVESNAAKIDPSEYRGTSNQFGQTTGTLYLFSADTAE